MTVSDRTDQSYGTAHGGGRPPLSDTSVIGLTTALTLGIWLARPLPLALVGVAVAAAVVIAGSSGARSAAGVVVVVAVVLAGSWAGHRAWQAAKAGPAAPIDVTGIATLLTDPTPVGSGRSVVIEVGGRRYEALAHGSPSRRLSRMLAGDVVVLEGQIGPSPTGRARRLAARHIVGRLDLDRIEAVGDGSLANRAANRVRRALDAGATGLPAVERSLFLGLVIGDDRHQPRSLVEEFREAGLSHLTAVSGQNVSFVLLLATPFLTRLRPAPRWVVTLGLIGWFSLLTRFEPSVLRAAGMAVLSATAFWRGRQASPVRALAITVGAFQLVDPLLVWSIGWWLSVGATAGIAVLAGPLERRLPGPEVLRAAVSVSLAANLGVLPVSLLVFGRSPLVSLVANLLAVPVAGLVMVTGIPGGLLAAAVPDLAPVVLLPSRLGTRWVMIVARLAAAIEPDGWGRWPGVAQLAAAGAVLVRRRRDDRDTSHRGDDG